MVKKININKRVMIVDDEPDVLISLKTVLERQNYDVITVTNGSECLKEIEKGFRGVILMDIMMPVMDGWETINQISKKGYTKDVAIEIITGKGTKDYQKLGLLGSYIYDYLTKPLNVEQLIKSVEAYNRYFHSKST
ncbi:MAG: response regulator [Candidatus Thermoplasmatota archaeon]|nr:response regulator [Candidatus Thermoplasmatota archaeon]